MFSQLSRFQSFFVAFTGCLVTLSSLSAELPEAEDLKSLVDPTTPLTMNNVVSQPQPNLYNLISNYKVESILIRPNMKVAVINSRRFSEGDMVGNAELTRINKDSVTLQIAGEEQILELYSRSVRTINQGDQ